VPSTQPPQVDFAECLRALSYVVHGEQHRVAVPNAGAGQNCRAELVWGYEFLLHSGRQ
jgi:hypothetical protein